MAEINKIAIESNKLPTLSLISQTSLANPNLLLVIPHVTTAITNPQCGVPGSTINPNLVESNFLGINNLTNLLGSSTEIPPLTNFSSQIDMSGISSPQEMFITYQFIKNTFFFNN